MIISFVNEDGGCGKTSLTSSTAEIVAFAGKKVLLVDASPKCSLTRLYLETQDLFIPETLYQLFNHNEAPKLQETNNPNIFLWAGHQTLEELSGFQYDLILREKLLETIKKEKFDYVFIDTFNDGVLVNAALCASDQVIIPCKPSRDSYEGVLKVLSLIAQLNANHNLDVKPLEILLNLYEDNSSGNRMWGALTTNEITAPLFLDIHKINALTSVNRYQWAYKSVGVIGGHLKSVRQLRQFVCDTILKEPVKNFFLEVLKKQKKESKPASVGLTEWLESKNEEPTDESFTAAQQLPQKSFLVEPLINNTTEQATYSEDSNIARTPYELEQERIHAREEELPEITSGSSIKDMLLKKK